MTGPSSSSWRRRVQPLLPGLVGTASLAVLCNAILELGQLVDVDGYPWRYKTPAFAVLFLLGCLVLWPLVGLVHALVGRLSMTTALMVSATAVVTFADHEKVRLRREPIYPDDWRFAGDVGFLTDMVGVRLLVLLAVAAMAAAVAAVLGLRAVRRRLGAPHPPAPGRSTGPRRLLLRVVTISVCLLSLTYLAHFNAPGNAVRIAYQALGATWRPWSQERNYLGNGFVGGFLYNMDVPAMAKPLNYSEAEMARIAATYRRAAARINAGRTGSLDDVNVVMVLSESFSDPTRLDGVSVQHDPIPFVRRLEKTTMSGTMLAQHIGGGTANMEFEALTGMSLSEFPPQMRVPYQALVPGYHSFPSAAGWLEGNGHRTVAIHPFTTEMYRRREVYQAFGFDRFVHDETMHERRRLGHHGYISDASAFDEVRRTLTTERAPVFVNLVTMQNHMPYAGRYDHPLRVTGPGGEPLTDTGQYARGLAYTDEAVRHLLGQLRRLREKTVVVFYGDHLPVTYPESVYRANSSRRMHETPFWVWANFPGPRGRQPTTSPIHFMDLILQRANAPVPPYYALLDELRHEVPAMEDGVLLDRSGQAVRRGHLSARAARLLHDYRLVQYDLSVGSRFSTRTMLGEPAGTVP